jgi:DNA-binding response OmpR family regulator
MRAGEQPKAKVLIIDDEQIVHESVRRILEGEGYRVDGALRVKDALDLLKGEDYDLVLSDLMMPDESGMKAVEAVARDHPHCGVVMFTGFATVESAVESMKLGSLDYLPKPFTPEELLEVLEKALTKVYKSRRDREIEETYSEAEKAIRSSLDLKEILNLICGSVVRLLQTKASALYMYKKQDQTLEIVASKGLSQEYIEKGVLDTTESLPQVLEAKGPLLTEDSSFDSQLQYPEAARKEGFVAMLSVPLRVKDAVLGILRLYSTDKRSFSDDEMDILTKFAEQGSRAIENAVSYERVRSDIEDIKQHIPEPVAQKINH